MSTYSDAYKEALVYAPTDDPIIETLSLEHDDITNVYIAKGYQDFTAYLEDTVTQVTFEAGFFNISIPRKNLDGVPDLNVSLGNADGSSFDLLESIKTSEKKLEVVYREYLSSDTSQPALSTPYRFQMKNVRVKRLRVDGRATFARDLKNTQVPRERYTLARFPGLA